MFVYACIYYTHIHLNSFKDVTDFKMPHHVSYTKREKKMVHFTVHINCEMNPVAKTVKIWNTES